METFTSSNPLVFVEPLANRQRNPAALLLEFGTADTETLQALLDHADFRRLTSQFPCLVLATDGVLQQPGLADMLQAAGCRLAAPESVQRTGTFDQNLPAVIQYIGGDWYMAPPAKPSGNQAASRALVLQLVQLVMAEAENHEIEAVLRRDPALSYHLLRLVNSLAMGMSKRITSFSQAILILGRAQLRRWLNLMLFSAREGDDRSAMLLVRVALRARSMELLAKTCGLDKSQQDLAFMAGMFSLLGTLFGQPLAEALRPLTISDALLAAVLEHEGELGRMLAAVETAESGDPVALRASLEALQVPAAAFSLLNIEAANWMLGIIGDAQGQTHA